MRKAFEECSGEGYGLACEALATVDARGQTARITEPTLLLCGSNEGSAFNDATKWMNETIPGSRAVEVPLAGHASVRERPEFVIETLRGFLG